jgi:pyruvate,orthophosphate dikinase
MTEKEIFFLEKKGDDVQINLIGYRGYILNKISSLDISIPNGFIISTDACRKIADNQGSIAEPIKMKLRNAITKLERDQIVNSNCQNQLLLSLRVSEISTSDVSETSMIELHYIGINEEVINNKNNESQINRRLQELYVSFVKQYGTLCLGVPVEKFNVIYRKYLKNGLSIKSMPDSDLTNMLNEMLCIEKIRESLSYDLCSQLEVIISNLIVNYFDIRNKKEFALIIQESPLISEHNTFRSGIIYSRNPLIGGKGIYGFFVSGSLIQESFFSNFNYERISRLQDNMPFIYNQLYKNALMLERKFKSVLEIFFFTKNDQLFVWDCFNTRLPVLAKAKAVIDMVREDVLNESEGILYLKPEAFKRNLFTNMTRMSFLDTEYITEGSPVSSGIVRGRIILEEKDFNKYAGESLVLIKEYLNPEDIDIISKVSGIVIAKGSATSHAVLVSKNLGKCCIIGVNDMLIGESKKEIYFGDKKINKGDWIILDGSSGKIYRSGGIEENTQITYYINEIKSWAVKQKKIKIMVNCDMSKVASIALKYGTDGIGLVRTENMFVPKGRVDYLRTFLLCKSYAKKSKALSDIERVLRNEIIALLTIMEDKPVHIRLLDFPLHEILPNTQSEKKRFSNKSQLSLSQLEKGINDFSEFNPMLGMRGCRLSILYPEFLEVQIKAIHKAMVKLLREGKKRDVYILIPFVIAVEEIKLIIECIRKVFKEKLNMTDITKIQNKLKIGVMIEQPCAALIADRLAKMVDFLAFGTNDLSQLMLGLSRDDSNKIIPPYLKRKVLKSNPFLILNEGVKEIIDIAIKKASIANPNIKIGICGEHATHPENFLFFVSRNFDYISCSLNDLSLAHFSAAYAHLVTNKKYNKMQQQLSFNEIKVLYEQSMEKINDAIYNNDDAEGKKIAMQWAKMICLKYGMDLPTVWKFFKRDIISKWFGKREHRRFSPVWKVRDVLEYMQHLPGNSFRISKFPRDIACHAESLALNLDERDLWFNIIEKVDKSVSIEVFPTISEHSMCFRIFNSWEEFYVEAGIGQAMYVFEEEQGKHPIVMAQFNNESQYGDQYVLSEKYKQNSRKSVVEKIKLMLKDFIKIHIENIRIRCEFLRYSLGVDYIAIEGYFDPGKPGNISVVDLDLPLDGAFMIKLSWRS